MKWPEVAKLVTGRLDVLVREAELTVGGDKKVVLALGRYVMKDIEICKACSANVRGMTPEIYRGAQASLTRAAKDLGLLEEAKKLTSVGPKP